VRDDHELCLVAPARLAYLLDGDAVPGVRVGDRREHAGTVVHVQGYVVPGKRIAHRENWQLSVGRKVRPAGPGDPVADDRDDVAEHGAGRRGAARARAVEHQPAGGRGLHEHRVVGSADAGERM
jgi:hypothetical protein